MSFSDFSEPVPKYYIYVRASSAYDDGVWTEDVVGATLNIYEPGKPPVNIPPAFLEVLEDIYLNYSSKNNIDKETLGFNFPEFHDPENKTVTIEIIGGATRYMTFDNTTSRVNYKPYQFNQFGKHELLVKLTDADGASRTYAY